VLILCCVNNTWYETAGWSWVFFQNINLHFFDFPFYFNYFDLREAWRGGIFIFEPLYNFFVQRQFWRVWLIESPVNLAIPTQHVLSHFAFFIPPWKDSTGILSAFKSWAYFVLSLNWTLLFLVDWPAFDMLSFCHFKKIYMQDENGDTLIFRKEICFSYRGVNFTFALSWKSII